MDAFKDFVADLYPLTGCILAGLFIADVTKKWRLGMATFFGLSAIVIAIMNAQTEIVVGLLRALVKMTGG